MKFNPIRAASDITNSYRDYLLSAFEFSDPKIHTEFERVLSGEFALEQGPFVQSTPPFKRSLTIEQLIARGDLTAGFAQIDKAVQPMDRPLYAHQVSALEKLAIGRNIVVATGTGSGKTESFLYPILNQLLTERLNGTLRQPGVRALLLYPMNALANDQIVRLRDILRNFPDITFGRYIGDTKTSRKAALENHRGRLDEAPLANELLSREEMQETPPHILITNFAMLEYLLLRPEDTNLFDFQDGKTWRFIVLDEVHTYQGAKGAEIAMLLRRVRDRVANSRKGVLQFIGTSATLGRGEEDAPLICKFAADLFGEDCSFMPGDKEKQDLITPLIEDLPMLEAEWQASETEIAAVSAALESQADLELQIESLAIRHRVDVTHYSSCEERLGRLFLSEKTTIQLRERLRSIQTITELKKTIFSGSDDEYLVHQLIDICSLARIPGEPYALISARYHHMLRALEGMFYCFNPDHPENVSRLSLERRSSCEVCSTAETTVPAFELAPCKNCGIHYLVGRRVDEGTHFQFQIAEEFEERLEYMSFSSSQVREIDEDEGALGVPADDEMLNVLCTKCGAVSETSVLCGHIEAQFEVVVSLPKEPHTPIRTCVACSGRSVGSIIDRVQTGRDAPTSVIAGKLYQSLPEAGIKDSRQKVGQGRKLLTFSDSRQDAAFFAPYFERTYSRNVQRSIILDVLHSASTSMRFNELVGPIRSLAANELILDPEDSDGAHSTEVRKWLFREVLATDRRQSLGGVGLVRIRPARPRGAELPKGILELGLKEKEGEELALFLLDTLREQGAVHLDTIEITDPIFSPRNVLTSVRQHSSGSVLGFVPQPKFANRRSRFLSKIIEKTGALVDPVQILNSIWMDNFAETESPWSLLLPEAKDRGVFVRRLDYKYLEFQKASEDCPVFRCRRCSQVSWFSIQSLCTRTNCDGLLEQVEPHEMRKRGFREVYTNFRPVGMRVEEHTGQLDSDHATDLQNWFVSGDVNVLSCSTTFELGVDLGEIQSVLLKNVPPSPANYVQRAGRAGRRLNSAALVVTFAQRRSHDLYFFNHPEDLVKGQIPPPQISIDNERIARRHLHSVAFALFARQTVQLGKDWPTTVGKFFQSPQPDEKSVAQEFREWLEAHHEELQNALLRIFPELAGELGIQDWSWVDALYEDSEDSELGWLHRATKEILEDFEYLGELIVTKQAELQELPPDDRKAIALGRRIQSLRSQFATISERKLLDHLATRVVLPKYGFPVDVVSLDVWRSGDNESAKLDLTRDLRMGILDFAPTSTTVAAKHLWESVGLRIPPAKSLPSRTPIICDECGTFRSERDSSESGCTVCGSHQSRAGLGMKAVLPIFGFHGRRATEKPGETRPPRIGAISTYFSDFAGPSPERELVTIGNSSLHVRLGKHGQITVLNRGPTGGGFNVCFSCGYAEVPKLTKKRAGRESAPKPHNRPSAPDRTCTQSLNRRFLGHEFLTDTIEIANLGIEAEDDAWSALAALLSVLPVFGISQRDVSGTIKASGDRGRERALVIFDAVPGGAGFSRGIRAVLPSIFSEAFKFVSACGCGADTACYGCLKSYENQSHHEKLRRSAALKVLHNLGI